MSGPRTANLAPSSLPVREKAECRQLGGGSWAGRGQEAEG